MARKQSTGHSGLDELIYFLRLGDQVVWQVDEIADYQKMAHRLVQQAAADHKNCYYVHFDTQPLLFDQSTQLETLQTEIIEGVDDFELFTRSIDRLIRQCPPETILIFDNLSERRTDWGSDWMIENFFRIICPALSNQKMIAYIALSLGAHASDTIAEIRDQTQMMLNLYHCDTAIYIHPLHVRHRYTPEMYWPHRLVDDRCVSLSEDEHASSFLKRMKAKDWSFNIAAERLDPLTEEDPAFTMRMRKRLLTDEERMGQLVNRYFTFKDLVDIKMKMLGTGKIGGKSVGMLLARNIVQLYAKEDDSISDLLEPHDSYYIGTDFFYTYIVQNKAWALWMEQKEEAGYYSKAKLIRDILLNGSFSDRMHEAFRKLLETFNESPIIVRSSSLLEDDFGNAFAGKYESVFCANQGPIEERLVAFEQAVRVVYASTMSQDALKYRMNRNLNQKEEQMAVLVQRVSGRQQGHYFYPLMAGVAHSENLYVWNDQLDVRAGMLRLVFGLGTRAVDRVEGDYPRLVALDQPLLSSHASKEDENNYSQRFVDMIDLEANELVTLPLEAMLREDPSIQIGEVGEIDWDETNRLRELGYYDQPKWVLNFKKLLSNKSMMQKIRSMTRQLEAAYEYPVDIEFTINLLDNKTYQINLLQCRPLQTKSIGRRVAMPETIDKRNLIIESKGHFMGGNVRMTINYIVYVKPELYTKLAEQEKYQVARIIGLLNHKLFDVDEAPTLLLGPGRWGTTTPSLGVPVQYSEIDNIAALGEVSFEVSGMMPELSFGSHFFQDLVEGDVFYMAILPHIEGNYFDASFTENKKNIFIKILPEHYRWADVIGIYDFSQENLTIFSDITTQRLLCIDETRESR